MNDELREEIEEELGLVHCVFPTFGYCYHEGGCESCPNFPDELKPSARNSVVYSKG